MAAKTNATIVLFGGSGFIGQHLARRFSAPPRSARVVIADIVSPPDTGIESVRCDVRRPITGALNELRPDIIVNLAAVHREPGHEATEYFQTNILGAKNVTAYADAVGCPRLVFTSSISVYGPTEEAKDENSIPMPTTPYGISKLVAEHIHLTWQASDRSRKLVIVRPGVVYGAGENGNVTRLVKAVCRRYFLFTANNHVRKAGGYVKELCATIDWALGEVEHEPSRHLTFNFSAIPVLRLEEFVGAIAAAAGVPEPSARVPARAMIAASYALEVMSRTIGIKQPLHPQRARKLMRSTNIVSGVLNDRHYKFIYSLEQALEDWKREDPQTWH